MTKLKVPLRGERIILRNFRRSDFDNVHEYASDSLVCKFMTWGPNTKKDTKDFMARAMKGELAIEHIEDKKVIGGCRITVQSGKHKNADLGYCLNKKYWNQGLTTEATKLLIGFGFSKLKMHRIYATCDIENIASRKVLQKCGMKKEGILRERFLIRGRWRSSYLFSILRKEWE